MSHHLAMFGSHWSIANEDIKYLIRQVTPQNRVIEEPNNYEWELFMVCHHLARFGGHKYCSNRDIFICHMIK